MKPTDEQVKEFWTLLADEIEDFESGHRHYRFNGAWCEEAWGIPIIDLNNLFKYAVPKLYKDKEWLYSIKFTYNYPNGGVTCEITTEKYLYMGQGKDPALALFWAIHEVIKND